VRGHVLLCHDLPRPKGSAADVALTFPALADRLTRESGWRVVTAALRGVGDSAGDFSALGWLDDLTFVAETEVPETSPRLVVGFGFGGVLALHLAAGDERVAGVACLGTPSDLGSLTRDPAGFLERCRLNGVITTPGFPSSADAWAKELSVLHPSDDAALLKGRPLLMVHGSDDADVPISDARALADAATGPSELHVVPGAGHWLRADPRVIAILVGWLERRH
jgi:putative redox protein